MTREEIVRRIDELREPGEKDWAIVKRLNLPMAAVTLTRWREGGGTYPGSLEKVAAALKKVSERTDTTHRQGVELQPLSAPLKPEDVVMERRRRDVLNILSAMHTPTELDQAIVALMRAQADIVEARFRGGLHPSGANRKGG